MWILLVNNVKLSGLPKGQDVDGTEVPEFIAVAR